LIGTPDMFRGVEKKIIIVAPIRNSQVEGLGMMQCEEYINLSLTRHT
jgi:superfamily I DNA and/or RNA helicase